MKSKSKKWIETTPAKQYLIFWDKGLGLISDGIFGEKKYILEAEINFSNSKNRKFLCNQEVWDTFW